jgi:O-antigen/teichoic acid export membrane protein
MPSDADVSEPDVLARVRSLLVAKGVSRRRLGYGITAELIRIVPSFVTFLVLPRLLGPARYGQLAALIAVIALVAALANVGAHIMFIRDVTRADVADRSAAGRALTTSILGGTAGVVLMVPIAALIFDHLGLLAIATLFFAELIFGNLLHVFSGFAIAREDQRGLAVFVGIYGAARIVSVVLYAASPVRGSMTGFAGFCLAGVVVASLLSARYASRRRLWDGPAFVMPPRSAVTEGMAVSSTAAVFYVQDGLDTPILVRSGYQVDAGNYATAYRVASLAFAPINALVLIGLPQLVTRTGRDETATRQTVVRLTLIGVAYGVAVCVLMQLVAPLIPVLLGHGYDPAVDILRWLSLLPLIRALQYFVANLMMVNGLQRNRLVVQFVSATVSLIAYLALIPPFSWRGAVAGTYVSEITLAAGLWLVFLRSAGPLRAETKQMADVLVA